MTASLCPACGALRQKLNNVVLVLRHLVWDYIGQVSWRGFCFERVFGRDETCCRHRQVSGLERQWGSLGTLKTQIKAGCTSTGCTVYIVQALAYKSLYFFLCHCVKGFIPFFHKPVTSAHLCVVPQAPWHVLWTACVNIFTCSHLSRAAVKISRLQERDAILFLALLMLSYALKILTQGRNFLTFVFKHHIQSVQLHPKVKS